MILVNGYEFDTTEPWSPIVESDQVFLQSSGLSWFDFDVWIERNDGVYAYFSIIRGRSDNGKQFFFYVDGNLYWSSWKSNSFTISPIFIGSLTRGIHTFTIAMNPGSSAWRIDHLTLGGGNYILSKIRSSTGSQFLPDFAKEEKNSGYAYPNICNDGDSPSYYTAVKSTPYFLFSENGGSGDFIINTFIKFDGIGCWYGGHSLYKAKITYYVRVIDSTDQDLSFIDLEPSDLSGSGSANSGPFQITWSLGGGLGPLGGSISFERGDGVKPSEPVILNSEVPIGSNNWKVLGFHEFSIGSPKELVRLNSDMHIIIPRSVLENYRAHNIQFGVGIELTAKDYFFNYWTKGEHTPSTQFYIVGDGSGDTAALDGDSWAVVYPGCFSSNQSQC